jgi:hypothetical protein
MAMQMEYKPIKLKKVLNTAVFLSMYINVYGQVRISNDINSIAVANSSAFIDASSNSIYNQSTNVGKGLLYPRTDLAAFTAFSGVPTGVPTSYPTLYDGLIVYNTKDGGVAGVGLTEGTLCRGFWYYDNPTSMLNDGTWRSLYPCSSSSSASITTLDCVGAANTGRLAVGTEANGVSSVIGYTGGNGGTHNGQVVASTGIAGLTATLAPGSFANGSGTLTYTITGIPSGPGTASFAINIGGKSCTVSFVAIECGANIAPGVYKKFLCYNLGADTSLAPLTPTLGIRGAKYQWGMAIPALTQTQDQTINGPVAGWNTTPIPDTSWLDSSKTANDPCPAGYRVPTSAQWQGVIDNNTKTLTGPLADGSYGVNFGPALMLPASGLRGYIDGNGNGGASTGFGYYWSSSSAPRNIRMTGATVVTTSLTSTHGLSVRCISE